jgi:hypothetical protein
MWRASSGSFVLIGGHRSKIKRRKVEKAISVPIIYQVEAKGFLSPELSTNFERVKFRRLSAADLVGHFCLIYQIASRGECYQSPRFEGMTKMSDFVPENIRLSCKVALIVYLA